MSAAHARRFAARGLLQRRRSVSRTAGCYERVTPPRPVDGAPWYPETTLPPGLLPLPAGFELRRP